MYVEDILMCSTEDQNMIYLTKFLNTEGIDLEEENDVAGLLGVQLTKTSGGSMMITQDGMIDRIIEDMSLYVN